MLIFGQKACFLGPRQLARQKVNIHQLVTIAIGFAVDIEYIDKISANSLNPPPRALSWGPEGRRLVNTCDQWPINASSIDVVQGVKKSVKVYWLVYFLGNYFVFRCNLTLSSTILLELFWFELELLFQILKQLNSTNSVFLLFSIKRLKSNKICKIRLPQKN